MKENSAHGFTEGSEVPKEQDAAHSFEEQTRIDYITRVVLNHLADYTIKGVIVRSDVQDLVIASRLLQSELTSLRSEMQKKDEEISLREAQQDVMAADIVKLLDQIEYQNKTAKEDHDKIKKLEFELQQERELRKELVGGLENFKLYYQRTRFPYKTQYEKEMVEDVGSLIEKAKLNN